MANIPKPMNPYAETDFDNAIDNALAELTAKEKHINKAVISYSYCGAYQDFIAILLHNGYEVTAKIIHECEMQITWGDKA